MSRKPETRAIDDPVQLARAARIIRLALVRAIDDPVILAEVGRRARLALERKRSDG